MAQGDAELECTILTPEGKVYSGKVTSVVAPGVAGSFGVLRGHAPLITALASGVLRVRATDGTHRWRVTGGFLEVFRNQVSVLAEKVETVAERSAEARAILGEE